MESMVTTSTGCWFLANTIRSPSIFFFVLSVRTLPTFRSSQVTRDLFKPGWCQMRRSLRMGDMAVWILLRQGNRLLLSTLRNTMTSYQYVHILKVLARLYDTGNEHFYCIKEHCSSFFFVFLKYLETINPFIKWSNIATPGEKVSKRMNHFRLEQGPIHIERVSSVTEDIDMEYVFLSFLWFS